MKERYFILRANSGEGTEFIDNQVEYFLVALTPDIIKRIKEYKTVFDKLQKKDSNLFQIEIFDNTAIPLPYDVVPQDMAELVDADGDLLEVEKDQYSELLKKANDLSSPRIDTLTVSIMDLYIQWVGYYKNTSVEIRSGSIKYHNFLYK